MSFKKIIFFIFLSANIFSQEFLRQIDINGFTQINDENSSILVPNISNGVKLSDEHSYFHYYEKIPIVHSDFEVTLANMKFENLKTIDVDQKIPEDLEYDLFSLNEKKQSYVGVKIYPYIREGSQTLILKSFSVVVKPKQINSKSKKTYFVPNSVLADGQWYKIAVEQDGIYTINNDFLNNLGLNSYEIDPKNIRIFGGQVGMLPEKNDILRTDDLQELSLFFIGDNDSYFEENEEILFYGQSPHTWQYNDNTNVFNHTQNRYSDQSYYFIKIDNINHKTTQNSGLSLEEIISIPSTEINNVYSFKERLFYEKDLYNLVSTGQQWFGEYFGSLNQLSIQLDAGGSNLNDSIYFRARVAARSSIVSKFEFKLMPNLNSFCEISIPPEISDDYYYEVTEEEFFLPNINLNNWGGNIIVNYQNNGNPSALSWLDFIEINFNKNLQYFNDNQLVFRSFAENESDLDIFYLPNETNLVFDVTDPFNMTKIQIFDSNDNNNLIFGMNLQVLSEFIAIKDNSYLEPMFIEQISNQNLHSLSPADLIIVAHNDFISQANRLADFHQNINNIDVVIVSVDQVYNEFSGGSQDPVAIRDFVRMLYNKASNEEELPKNLLLFGDASFDYKNITDNNTNFVPTYQSYRSDNIKISYCSDDFFGMLDENEGDGASLIYDLMDIGVGRITVQTSNEAEQIVDKIINYSSLNSRGDWKNKICFISDDVDDNWEINLLIHADALATKVDTNHLWINVDKIYTDAYPQLSTAGGERYPEAQQDIIELIEEGALIVNYIGHGGEVGWASERILELTDINEFENFNQLPVFVTATCEFSRYDDPNRVSAGEQLLLNPNGGAISLFSTSRTVNESSAYYIVDALYNYILNTDQNLTMGEIMRLAKNDPSLGITVNKRKFAFLGDPALKISYPKYNVKNEQILIIDNDKDKGLQSDTINALSKVKVIGKTTFENSDKKIPLNGILNVTVYGKEKTQNTLNNNGLLETPFSYISQKDIIYKGKVNVINGEFEYNFIVPKDIPMDYGKGKLSYYVNDIEMGDGAGNFENFYVGGINSNAKLDNLGPEIQLFINDTTFVSGGYTDDSPNLLALLYDNSGINTVGTGIGHDLVAILDGLTNNPYILNDNYESDLNTYQSGRVSFEFSNIEEGPHTLNLKAWDVYNNSSSKQISFIVAKSEEIIIKHLLNYPNPFSNFTRFSFEHNRPNEIIDVLIQVFSVSGKLVKTLSSEIINSGYRDDSIVWDGFDQYGDKLGKGVYIYKVILKSKNDGSNVEKFEKLVILQ